MEDYSWVDPEYLETHFSYTQDAKVMVSLIEVGSLSY